MLYRIYRSVPHIILRHTWSARFYFRVLHQVVERLRKPPILIYQMGKVGSATILESLSYYNLDRSIYHIHNLIQSLAEEQLAWAIQTTGTKRRYDNLWNSLYLSHRVALPAFEKWKIITLVREPVGRNMSWFFQVMDRLYPDLLREGITGKFKSDQVLQTFLDDNMLHHSEGLMWFDNQLKAVFDIDVYSSPFPRENGYAIYENDRARVLLIRLEDLNDCAADAFREFMGIDNFSLRSTNIGEMKTYHKMYKPFLADQHLPDTYLDMMYKTKYTRHFYSETEIESFRNKWRGA